MDKVRIWSLDYIELKQWVEKIVRKTVKNQNLINCHFEDLVAEGIVGIISYAKIFDPKKGVPFKAFCYRRVKGAIIDYCRKEIGYVRPLCEVTPSDFNLNGNSKPDPEREIYRRDVIKFLSISLNEISVNLKTVVKKRYIHDQTLSSINRKNRATASKQLKKSFTLLRKKLNKKSIFSFYDLAS